MYSNCMLLCVYCMYTYSNCMYTYIIVYIPDYLIK